MRSHSTTVISVKPRLGIFGPLFEALAPDRVLAHPKIKAPLRRQFSLLALPQVCILEKIIETPSLKPASTKKTIAQGPLTGREDELIYLVHLKTKSSKDPQKFDDFSQFHLSIIIATRKALRERGYLQVKPGPRVIIPVDFETPTKNPQEVYYVFLACFSSFSSAAIVPCLSITDRGICPEWQRQNLCTGSSLAILKGLYHYLASLGNQHLDLRSYVVHVGTYLFYNPQDKNSQFTRSDGSLVIGKALKIDIKELLRRHGESLHEMPNPNSKPAEAAESKSTEREAKSPSWSPRLQPVAQEEASPPSKAPPHRNARCIML